MPDEAVVEYKALMAQDGGEIGVRDRTVRSQRDFGLWNMPNDQYGFFFFCVGLRTNETFHPILLQIPKAVSVSRDCDAGCEWRLVRYGECPKTEATLNLNALVLIAIFNPKTQ